MATNASFEGKVGLVTGGASGLGRATAVLMAAQGATVVVADRTEQDGLETIRQIKEAGHSAHFLNTDVTNIAQVAALVDFTVALRGRLDFAVNNAGIEGERANTAECTEENWARVIGINLTGTWRCLKHELAAMSKLGRGGAIVNVASTAALGGAPNLPAYDASKHGMIGLTKTAALEFARQNIRVNAICPGSFFTPMTMRIHGEGYNEEISAYTPLGRVGHVDEIAQAILWLCSDLSSWVTGVALPVEGGKRAG